MLKGRGREAKGHQTLLDGFHFGDELGLLKMPADFIKFEVNLIQRLCIPFTLYPQNAWACRYASQGRHPLGNRLWHFLPLELLWGSPLSYVQLVECHTSLQVVSLVLMLIAQGIA
ncbi:hypothetical protein FGO68_gene7584 [Halteria grandinella]|uniref:Uncharacterized protein n=1 Tax=Halteria grandinella TaxID=5974 RepID=A0A8J8NGL9_HALGN|nr:hypothetical protein FGO68_gene7584 [Halteria grandinella]